MLLLLGGTAAVLGCAAVGLAAPGVVALPLGMTIWVTARRDLIEMREGRRDPTGAARTDAARQWAMLGTLATIAGWVFWIYVFFRVWLRH